MIPAELRERDQWVLWRREKRGDKDTKVPYRVADPVTRASSTDPATWAGFDAASAAASEADGIGYVFAADDPYTGIDLDDCLDERGELARGAQTIVEALDSYTERSVSGGGVHVLVRARLNGSRRRATKNKTPWRGEFEAYDHGRYFAMTGQLLADASPTIEARQEALDKVLGVVFPPPAPARVPPDVPKPDLGDEELLERAFAAQNGTKLEALYRGDRSGYGSPSEADLALCNMLSFWVGPDPGGIDHLFRRSGLMRTKWDERHGTQTYGAMTIAKALEGRVEFYEPDKGRADLPDLSKPESTDEQDAPLALWLDEFLAQKTEMPPALIGDSEDVILPVAGFAILGGKGGRGKTTLMVDGALHLASGVDWLGFTVPQPLNVLLVENEGSREMFRRKLAAKREGWPHELKGKVAVYTFDWGGFDLRSEKTRSRLRAFLEENEVDLVFCDPLDSCGFEGVGSPEDTRDFMALAKSVGLHRDVAFWFCHHPKKDKMEDELDSLSGAWGGRPDTVFTLNTLEGNRARLGIPKTRWGKTGKRSALILSFDPETESFELLKEETEGRDYVEEIAHLLADTPWLTVDELMAPADKGGIGAGRPKVKEALESERFIQREGAEVGRSSKAHAEVWGLA